MELSSSCLRSLGRPSVPAVLLALALLGGGGPLEAQVDDDGSGVRFGITVGGTSFAGLSLEFISGHQSVELSVGTWAARDLSVSVVGRQYLGAAAAKPVVGAGLWLVVAWPPDDGYGMALLARAPIGVDWNPGGDHYLALDLNVSRGLWVRRTDPDDETPMSQRLVPLPGLAYRWEP
jgi:hypothetical protein